MSLKTTGKTEIVPMKKVHGVVYGEPEIGKTSILSTCNSVIVVGFEDRVYRTDFRSEVVRVKDWNTLRTDVAGLKTIVEDYEVVGVDTAGSMVNCIMSYIDVKFPSAAIDNRQYYGKINTEIKWFLNVLENLEKDVIFAIHEASGDKDKKKPDLPPKAHTFIVPPADFIGYMWKRQNQRHINFNNTTEHYGKNSAHIPAEDIPDFNDAPLYLQGVIDKTKAYWENEEKESEDYKIEVQKITDEIESLQTPADFNAFVKKPMSNSVSKRTKENFMSFIIDTAKTKGIKAAGKGKGFVWVKPPAEPQKPAAARPAPAKPAPAARPAPAKPAPAVDNDKGVTFFDDALLAKSKYIEGLNDEYRLLDGADIFTFIGFFTKQHALIEVNPEYSEMLKAELIEYIESEAANCNIIYENGQFVDYTGQ